MHLLIREGEVVVEITEHAGERPRICAWLAKDARRNPDAQHLSREFDWSQWLVLEDLRTDVRQVLSGIRPQLEAKQRRMESQ